MMTRTGVGDGVAASAPATKASAVPAARAWTVWLLALITGLLAFWVVQEIRVQDLIQETVAVREEDILSTLVAMTYNQTNELETRITTLKAELSSPAPNLPILRAELAAAQSEAGFTTVKGAGVVVSLSDSPTARYAGEPPQFRLVHDQYVLHVVGLLEGAGAAAVYINGQRFVTTTSVFCAGPTIRVNGVNEGSPFLVEAVGPVKPMLAALQQDPDVQGWAQLVQLHYRASSALTAPALATPPVFKYAKLAQGAPQGG